MSIATLMVLFICPAGSAEERAAQSLDEGPASSPAAETAQESPPPEHESDSEPSGFRTVVVTHRSRTEQTAASTTRLPTAVLRASPARSTDDLLRQIPAALVVQHGTEGKGHQLFLRGFDAVHGSDVELWMGGVPLNEPSNVHGHGYLDLAFIPAAVVREVQVDKGPFDARQGNHATAGTVRLALGVPRRERGASATYTLGSSNRHQLDLVYAPVHEPSRSFVAAELMRDDGYGENRRAQRLALLGNWALLDNPTRGIGELDLLAAAYAGRFGLPGALRHDDDARGAVGFYDTYANDAEGSSERLLLGLHQRRVLGSTALESNLFAQWRALDLEENFTGALVDPVNGDRRHQRQRAWTTGANLALTRPLGWGLSLESGLQWRTDGFNQLEDHIAADGRALDRRRDLDAVETALGPWAQLRWRPLAGLSLRAGGRADLFHYWLETHRDTDATAALSPRLSAAWEPKSSVTLFAAYGHGLRSPEARAFAPGPADTSDRELERYRPGAPRITESRSGELGAIWLPGRALELSLAGFATYIEREYIFDHVAGTTIELNSTRRLGGELSARLRALSWLELRGDAALTDARFVESDNPVPGAPRAIGSIATYLQHPSGLHAGARLLYLGARPLAHGAIAGDAAVAQVSAGWRFARWRLGVEVDNALGGRWREAEYHYASWWSPEQPRSSTPVLHYVAGPPLTARLHIGVKI